MLQRPNSLTNPRRPAAADKAFRSTVKKYLTPLSVLPSLLFWLIPTELCAREPQIKVEQILQTTKSWDGSSYTSYPTGKPQVTVLRITIPPNTALHWHHHPVISVGYIVSGHLTIEKKASGERRTLHAGEALAETVQTTHRGFTTDEPVELIVFYAGQIGLPITINEQ
jgi:quercetin dioxygenase-like cupin family protein